MIARPDSFEVALLGGVGAVLTAVGAGVGTYIHAPRVGGAWWPYIRVIAALVVGYVAAPIGYTGMMLLLLAGVYLGVIE